MSQNKTVIVAGPCAVESEEQVMDTAYKISQIREIAKPYGFDFKLRGGAWKPRTKYYVQNGKGLVERVFEGVGEIGLKWLAHAADKYDLPIVSELMSEMDLRYFHKHLIPERDYIQIGARTSKAYALLFYAGVSSFGIVVKNPEHGVINDDAEGSLQRAEKNREVVYCTRGQIVAPDPSGIETPEHKAYIHHLRSRPNQHPDARNLNNIAGINLLRQHLNPNIKFCHDPSHTWGGKTHEMRRRIGEYAIKALTEYDYDWIMVEVNDKSKDAKCDAPQALATTLNSIDWSQTHVGEAPPENQMPFSLVDIVTAIMSNQGIQNIQPALEKLEDIKWDATPK